MDGRIDRGATVREKGPKGIVDLEEKEGQFRFVCGGAFSMHILFTSNGDFM